MALSLELKSTIASILKSHDVAHHGFTSLEKPLSFEIYQNWIAHGMHGEMEYLKTHLPQKSQPQELKPGLRSALVIAQDYLPSPRPAEIFSGLRTALYAQGEDYHFWFKEKLQKIADELKTQFPDEEFLVFTDSGPILERDLAKKAGLGWVGKNTCLIEPKRGSLFFIGEILSTVDFSEWQNPEIPDFCGTCTRCIDVCPTKAITRPKEVDARLCISYWTIESREVAPPEIREKFQDWFFGCDLCQTICPWNEKVFHFSKNPTKPAPSALENDLRFLLTASGKQIEKKVLGTPLKRAGPFGLRRNALMIIGNQKISSLKAETERWSKDPKLGELARWALERI